jgi:hypothetical protein
MPSSVLMPVSGILVALEVVGITRLTLFDSVEFCRSTSTVHSSVIAVSAVSEDEFNDAH